ncbi:hypothetical protein UlMin_006129 [Ulmus minor]
MLVNTNTRLKLEKFGVSCFYKEHFHLFSKTTWRSACFPASRGVPDLTKRGFIYTKISSPIMEKIRSNVVIKDLEDLPAGSSNESTMEAPSYESTMEALSSLITQQKRGDRAAAGGKYEKLERMSMYLKILGLDEHIVGLKIVHVAGTKGKGSTCTFCEAILRECGFRTGLFTSPHLIDVRERFRIDGLEITEDKFLHYFWDCWRKLEENITDDLPMPPLFQFLTVLAFKIFVSERVDVAIVEVGLGGTMDSTNVINEPVVCGITSLGMDHTETLGYTLREIASHKAGIFKPKIPAFTVPQLSEAMDVIQERASELLVPLEVSTALDHKKLDGLELSLAGDHQFINAGLAVSLCKCWLQRTGNWEKLFKNEIPEADLPEAFRRGLSSAHLSGRAQILHDISSESCDSNVFESTCGDLIFYLDGAHSPESMEVCAKWFSKAVETKEKSSISSYKVGNMNGLVGNGQLQHEKENIKPGKISKQILLFNCMNVRDPQILLPHLVNTCASSGTHFSKAIFVPSMSSYTKVTSGASFNPSDIFKKDLSWQFHLQRLWEKIIHGKDVAFDEGLEMNTAKTLPREFLYEEDASCGRPTDNHFASSAVMPSLPLTIKWLRDCVKDNPSIRLQVLVTGSLHLVGDVLKLLKR